MSSSVRGKRLVIRANSREIAPSRSLLAGRGMRWLTHEDPVASAKAFISSSIVSGQVMLAPTPPEVVKSFAKSSKMIVKEGSRSNHGHGAHVRSLPLGCDGRNPLPGGRTRCTRAPGRRALARAGGAGGKARLQGCAD